MKKVSLIIAAAMVMLFAGNTQAQLGINFGYAPQTTTTTIGNNNSSSDLTGFFAGVNYNKPLASGIGLSVGADFRYNTKSESTTILSATTTTKQTQMIVDIPVLVNFGIALGSEAQLSLFVGPTVSYALSGNTNVSENVLNTSTDINWYGEKSNNSQLDLLGTFGAALTYQQFRLFGGYRIGLLDLDKRDNVKSTTSGIFVGLGYILK
ncbi:MAG: outer membrane beta-barrel protein [Bacteroidales bacterium]|nr:outer membrane beta-barrel protein [Bacteroidales bacterium]